MNNRLINTKVAGGGGCTDIVDNYDPFDGNGVALYQLNGNANDVSGNYNGTAYNVTYGTGVFGQAGVFNGTSSYISTATTNAFNLQTFTVSVWAKLNSFAPDLLIVSNSGTSETPSGTGWNVAYYDSTNAFYFGNAGVNLTFTTTPILTNVWYHIVATVDLTSNKIKIFLNGVFENENTYNGISYNSGTRSLRIGKVGYYDELYWNGSIDQVRIFNTALDPLEIEALYTEELCICDGTVDTLDILGDGSCIATYQLDGNANDLSGNYSGTPTDVSYGVGEFDLAGVFNGSSSRVAIPNIVNQAANHSASIWINPTNFNANRGALSMFNGSHLLVYVTTDAGLNSQGAPSAAGSTAGTLTANAWNHIVLSYNYSTTTYTMYVNGVNRGVDVNFNFSGRPNSIGCHHTGPSYGAFFLGSIDQVRIFNKALSQAEVTTLYNETACAPGGCSGTADTLNILGDGSCIAAYPLDGSPADLSGNYNGVQTNVTYPQGEFDLAGAFNGSSSVIVLPSNIIPTNYVASLSVWVKGASFSNSGSADIIFQNANGGPFFALITQNNVLELFTRNSSASNYRPFQYSLSNFNTTDWYHICVTFSGLSNTVNLYVNGVNVDSGSLQSSSLTYTLSNTIGNQEGSEIGWNGLIDQVRFFNKALSAGEVTTLYNETPCS